MKLLVATRSRHKLQEIRTILSDLPTVQVLGLNEAGVEWSEAEEDLEPFHTFRENAQSKAAYYFARTGLPTVADDSGLEVEALDGAPGVWSKRFAPPHPDVEQDEANNRHLLDLLAGVPEQDRGARYICVAAFVDEPEAPATFFTGTVQGRILSSPRGEGGFGYDPLFHVEELGCTFAETDEATKNRLSHRGAAFRALKQHLARAHP